MICPFAELQMWTFQYFGMTYLEPCHEGLSRLLCAEPVDHRECLGRV